MRFNNLDLNLLVALDALLTERSISRAAERVHLSQSTLSHSLARLREHFEDELLVQVGRKMELTPRAESLRDPIRDILVRIGSAVELKPAFDPAKSDRQFVLHVSDYSMERLFPRVLALAEQQHSRVRFRLLPQTGNPTRLLERGEVDVLLIPEDFRSVDHPIEPIFRENFVVMMWSGSRLARADFNIDTYAAARHIVMEPVGTGHPAYENWLVQRHGVSRHIEVSTYNFTAIPSMLVGTELVATVHARLARHAAATMPLKVVPLPVEIPDLVQVMQWHKHRTQDPGLGWLRTLIKQAGEQMDIRSMTTG